MTRVGGCVKEGAGGWGSVRRVSVMLAVSWPQLASPPPGDDGIFTECVGRVERD